MVGSVKEPVSNYDLMTVVVLGLGDPEDSKEDSILRLLSVLLSSETAEREKKQILRDDFAIPMTETLERSLAEMCNLSKGVEEKGVAKGRAEGCAEGRIETTLSFIQNLMDSMGLSLEQAVSALKISEEERLKYAKMLKQ